MSNKKTIQQSDEEDFDPDVLLRLAEDESRGASRADRPAPAGLSDRRARPRNRHIGDGHLIAVGCAGLVLLWMGTLIAFAAGYYGFGDILRQPDLLAMLTALILFPSLFLAATGLVLHSAQRQHRISSEMARAARQLLTPDQTAQRNLSTMSQIIRQEIDDVVAQAEGAMDRVEEMQEALARHAEQMGKLALDTQDRIVEARNTLEGERDNITRLTLDVRAGAEKIAGHIVEQAGTLSQASSRAMDGFQALEEHVEGYAERVAALTNDAVNRAKSAGEGLEHQFTRLETVSENAVTKAETIRQSYLQHEEEIEKSGEHLTEHSAAIEARINTLRDLIGDLKKGLEGRLQETRGELEGALTIFEEAARRLEDRSGEASQKLREEALSLEETAEAAAGTLLRAAETAQAFEREAKSTLRRFSSELTDSADELVPETKQTSADTPSSNKPASAKQSVETKPSRPKAEKKPPQPIPPAEAKRGETKEAPAQAKPREGKGPLRFKPVSTGESDDEEGHPDTEGTRIGLGDWISTGREAPLQDDFADALEGSAFAEAKPLSVGAPGPQTPSQMTAALDELEIAPPRRAEAQSGGAAALASQAALAPSEAADDDENVGFAVDALNGSEANGGHKPGWREILKAADQPFAQGEAPSVSDGTLGALEAEVPGLRILSHRAQRLAEVLKQAGLPHEELLQEVSPVPLYARFVKGDAVDLSDRLLTVKGKQLAAWTRTRYWEDEAFRDLSDKYLGEFEAVLRRLAELRKSEPDFDEFMRSGLGQVYFVIGAATGRFA